MKYVPNYDKLLMQYHFNRPREVWVHIGPDEAVSRVATGTEVTSEGDLIVYFDSSGETEVEPGFVVSYQNCEARFERSFNRDEMIALINNLKRDGKILKDSLQDVINWKLPNSKNEEGSYELNCVSNEAKNHIRKEASKALLKVYQYNTF